MQMVGFEKRKESRGFHKMPSKKHQDTAELFFAVKKQFVYE